MTQPNRLFNVLLTVGEILCRTAFYVALGFISIAVMNWAYHKMFG